MTEALCGPLSRPGTSYSTATERFTSDQSCLPQMKYSSHENSTQRRSLLKRSSIFSKHLTLCRQHKTYVRPGSWAPDTQKLAPQSYDSFSLF